MASNWVCCIMHLSILLLILSSRWVAVAGEQAANLVGICNRKQPDIGRGCLPEQRISSRAKKQTLGAEGAAITITGTARFGNHQGNDATWRGQVVNACRRDRQRDGSTADRAGRLHARHNLEQRGIGQRIKRAPGVELLPIHPKAMGRGDERQSPSHDVAALVYLEIS